MGAQIEKICDLGKNVRDSSRATFPTSCNKGKEPVVPNDVDTLTDDELSLGSSPSLTLSLTKNARVRCLHITLPSTMPLVARPIGEGGRQAGGRTSHEPVHAPRNALVLPEGAMPPCIAQRYNATNAARTSFLRYRANVLHAVSSLNSGTRRYALFALGATHS